MITLKTIIMLYLENKLYLRSLRKLYRVLKRERITTDKIEWFVNMVKIGTYKIPELQNEYQKIKNEVEVINHK
jgi:predicted transcriptional regulator